MSSIRFAGDGDNNVGVGTRSRKSKRRTSSILKAQSPSRMALGDLDPNAAERNKALDAKKKRRSSKRVSFADTMHVQEFWTEHHAKELGLWDSSQDSSSGESSKKQKGDADSTAQQGSRSEEQSDGYDNQQGRGDTSVGLGHNITGLETLLTGQIRNAPTDAEPYDAIPEPELPPAVAQLQSEMHELSSVKETSAYDPSSIPASQTNQGESKVDNQLDDLAFDLPFEDPQVGSTSSESSQTDVKITKHSRRSLTLTGAASYLCRLPSNESTMSMSVDQSMDQRWSTHQQMMMNQSQGTADMDMTGQMSFSHHDVSAQRSPDEKTDNQSFFQKLMASNNTSAATITPLIHDGDDVDDVFINDNASPDEKTDNTSFFEKLRMNREEENDKLDSKKFLAALFGGNSSTKGNPDPAANRTQMFGLDETNAGMDFTTCIGGIQPNQELSTKRQPLGERSQDMTVRFGRHDGEGDMEMTKCYDGNKTADISVRMPKQTSKANATQLFDQTGGMEFTTCLGGITGNDQTQFTTANNQTQFTTANLPGLTFLKDQTFSNMTLNNTSTILRGIDNALGLKRKSDVLTDEFEDTRTGKQRRGDEEPYESTRVFSGTFVPQKPSHQTAPVFSPIKKESGDVNHGVCGEETAAIELTSCIRAREFNNIQNPDAPNALESTRIFHADESAGMELTTCVDNSKSQRNVSVRSVPVDNKGNRTRVFSADDSGDMEMTACQSVIVSTEKPSSSLIKPNQSVKAPADLERTKVFKPDDTCGMEFTACVGDLIVGNTTSKEAAHNTSVRRVTKPNQRHEEMDKTKVFQPDETCGMEFTTCVDNVIVNPQSEINKSSQNLDKSAQRYPQSTMDSTKIFQPNETCGMEFTTCLTGQIDNRNNTNHIIQFRGNEDQISSGPQKSELSLNKSEMVPCGDVTKVFSDNTAKMDMTECIGGVSANISHVALQGDRSLASNCSHVGQEERTRVFTDDANGMEMTECIGGALPNSSLVSLPRGKSHAASFSHPDQGDKTRVFGDDIGGMEMTQCVGEILANTSKASTVLVKTTSENQGEKTMIGDDVGGMEMTACVGGLISGANGQNKSVLQMSPRDHTKLFTSEDTAKMDMTECVGTLYPDFLCETESNQNKSLSRLHSQKDDNGATTECDGEVSSFPSLAMKSASKANLSMSRLKALQADFDFEETQVFSGDNDGMEMTECVTSAFPKFAHNKTANKTLEITEKIDCTRVFSEDTGKMEMTECVGSVFPSFTSAKKADKSSVVLDQTKVFNEDTCRMEMTECVGGVFPSCAAKPDVSLRDDDKENEHPSIVGHSRLLTKNLSTIEEVSICKTNSGDGQATDVTSRMDVTEFIGIADVLDATRHFEDVPDILSQQKLTDCTVERSSVGYECNNAKEKSFTCTQQYPGEHTKVFSEHTAGMEMTECVGGGICSGADVNSDVIVVSTDVKGENAGNEEKDDIGDATKVFSEHTARMEMTECIGGGVLSGPPENVNTESTISRVVDENGHGERTKVFSEHTAMMDMTECVDGGISTAGVDDKVSSKDVNCSLNVSVQSKGNVSQTAEDADDKRRSDTFTLEDKKMEISDDKEANETKRTSDTFTINNTRASTNNEEGGGSKEEEMRRSDTFTIDQSSLQAKSCDKVVKEGQGDAVDGERLSSVESYSGDGILEEETLLMDNTEDLGDYNNLLKKGLKEPGAQEEAEFQMSVDASVFDGSCYGPSVSTLGSSQSTSRSIASSSSSAGGETLPSLLSQADKSLLASSILDINTTQSTLPTSGPVQMDEFLDFLSLASTLPKGRRSNIMAIQPEMKSQAETLEDFLELSLITQPKYQMFDWANQYLTTSVEKSRENIKEQEERLSKDNPAIVKEFQHATPEKCEELRRKVIGLHESCMKSVKKMFKEWRKKMTITNLDVLNKHHQALECRVSTVCSSTKKIEDSLADLEKYDAELDAAISQLEDTKLPSAEEQQKYSLDKEHLDSLNQQVKQQKETIAALEKQKADLETDVKSLQATHQEMESQLEALVCKSPVCQVDKEEAMDRINRIHRMQEWKLEEYKTDGSIAKFTFLEGSLCLLFKLGNTVGDEGDNIREIVDVSWESLLADDACIAAKVSNAMALKSVDVELLKRQSKTTKQLPQVLQQLSSKLCPARLLYDEVADIAFWHQISYSEYSLTVEFSSLEARLKFYVTFDLTPGAYPMRQVTHRYRHKIGHNIEQELQEKLSMVKPGWNYLSRLTSTIEELIKSRIPKPQGYL